MNPVSQKKAMTYEPIGEIGGVDFNNRSFSITVENETRWYGLCNDKIFGPFTDNLRAFQFIRARRK